MYTSGKQGYNQTRKSRFDDGPKADRMEMTRKSNLQEDLDSVKSIRVQMRNALKQEVTDQDRDIEKQFNPPTSESKSNKDYGLDEWMTKPKVSVDIDTQKFAAIVREKHGIKEKEVRENKPEELDTKLVPAAPVITAGKDIRDTRRDDRHRMDKVELQISSRDKDRDIRDRFRDRDSRSRRR